MFCVSEIINILQELKQCSLCVSAIQLTSSSPWSLVTFCGCGPAVTEQSEWVSAATYVWSANSALHVETTSVGLTCVHQNN